MTNKKKTALVIGSGGLGSLIARTFSDQEYDVYATYHTSKPNIPNVTLLQCDVTNGDSVKALVTKLSSEISQLDVVVETVSGPLELEQFPNVTLESLQQELLIAASAPMRLVQQLLPLIKNSSSATILFILSNAIETLPARMSAYTIGKYARLGVVKCMASELKGGGVRVIGVSPGFIETNLIEVFPSKLLELERSKVGGTFILPEELAEAIALMVESTEPECGTHIVLNNTAELREFIDHYKKRPNE